MSFKTACYNLGKPEHDLLMIQFLGCLSIFFKSKIQLYVHVAVCAIYLLKTLFTNIDI